MTVIVYHNPRCSKSRATLDLIVERGIEPEIVEYLESPPSVRQLKEIVTKLGIRPRDLLRTGESTWKSLELHAASAEDDVLLEAMAEHPILIERPIVVVGDRARIGRPPEAVLEILP